MYLLLQLAMASVKGMLGNQESPSVAHIAIGEQQLTVWTHGSMYWPLALTV